MIFGTKKNIFEILKEEDEQQNAAADNNADDAPAPEETDAEGKANAQQDQQEDDFGGEDDFNIDANLDEEEGGDNGETDNGGETEDLGGGGDTDTGTGDNGIGEPEANKDNTDIFSSLSAEEQFVKIKELQKQFGDLYTSTDDVLKRINDIRTDEDTSEIIGRVSTTIYSLKKYIYDYIHNIYPYKSFIENDIAFNRFLSILNSVTSVLNDVAKAKMDKLDK